MRLLLTFLLLGVFGLPMIHAQECNEKITGRVLSIITNEPLSFATVQVIGTENGAIVGDDGHFVINDVCEGELDLEVRFVGYKSVVHHHDPHHAEPIIFLAPDEALLESIVIEEELNAHELKSLRSKSIYIENSESLGSNSGEIFSKTSGVSTLRTGQNVVKPMVHGLHSNRILIINNGVRHSYQAWGTEHAPEIDPTQINRLRFVKGASTVRFGSDAIGGVILFDAEKPSYNSDLNGSVSAGYQTNGRAYSMEGTVGAGGERTAWSLGINGTKQGDLKAPNYNLTNTGKNEFGFSGSGRLHFSWIDLDLYANHYQQELGILRGSVNGNLEDLSNAIGAEEPNETKDFSYNITTPRQETNHTLVRLVSSIYLGNQQLDVQYAFQQNDRREFDIRRGTNNERPAINLRLISNSLDIDWDHPSKGKWVGTYGLQMFTQDNDNIPGTNTIPFVPNYNTTNIGLFGIESLNIGNTSYEAGVRFDFLNLDVRGRDSRNDIYRDNLNYYNFTFTGGIVHEFNEMVSFRTNIGTAWRAPNVGELYSFGKHQNIIEFGLWRYELFEENDSISTRSVLANDQKEVPSERGLKWIASLNVNHSHVEFEVTPYVNWIQNYIYLRPYGLTNTVRGTFPYFIHDQTDAVYSGVDIDIRNTWNDLTSTEIKASYVHAKDVVNNQYFLGVPPFNVQFDINRKIGPLTLTVSPSWTSRQFNEPPVISADEFVNAEIIPFNQFSTFDFLPAPDGFFLLDASVGYERENLSVRIAGDNLLNNSYRRYTDQSRYFSDDLGINIKLFASISF
ncbi:MAG: TonB-dependent receptor [bacterium]|nr:TonB-dependent receptor [bacterium]